MVISVLYVYVIVAGLELGIPTFNPFLVAPLAVGRCLLLKLKCNIITTNFTSKLCTHWVEIHPTLGAMEYKTLSLQSTGITECRREEWFLQKSTVVPLECLAEWCRHAFFMQVEVAALTSMSWAHAIHFAAITTVHAFKMYPLKGMLRMAPVKLSGTSHATA